MSVRSLNNLRGIVFLGVLEGVIFASLSFWILGSAGKLTGTMPEQIIALGRLTGILLTLTIYAQLLLMSRMPIVQRLTRGSMSVLHRWVGYIALGCIAAHVMLITLGYALRDSVSVIDQLLVFATSWEGVFHAILSVIAFTLIGFMSLKAVKKHMQYEAWYAFHLFLYGAGLFAFTHQIQSGDMSYGNARIFWIATAASMLSVFVYFRFLRPFWLFVRHRFRISRVVRETPTTVSIYITGRAIERFRFVPGQYAHFMFLQTGLSSHHPFSFSRASGTPELRITIKHLGDFSKRAMELRPGTPVIIDGPIGAMTLETATTDKYCFIAGGVGITPIASMILSLGSPQDAVAFVSNTTRADEPLMSEVAGTGITLHTRHTGEGDALLSGEEILRECPDIRERDIYICGPRSMMAALSASLRKLGVPPSHIHLESFAY